MSENLWGRVDDYIAERLVAEDAVLQATLSANEAAGLPAIDVSATQGRFLNLMVSITGARRVLEVGTLGGYSTIWMARALPADGQLVTLEFSPHHAAVARGNIWEHTIEDWIDNAYIINILETGLIYGMMRWPVQVSYRFHGEKSRIPANPL